MKKTLKILMALGAVAILTACGENGKKADENQTTPAPVTDTRVDTTCKITQGTPLTDSQITVHIVCTGSESILSAQVSTDEQVKNVDIAGSSIDDYVGFRNLGDGKSYKVKLEVIVDGQDAIKQSVSVTTKVTPEPSPSPEPVNNAPTCESFTVNALGDPTFTTSVASKIHDADGDTLTVFYTEVGDMTGDIIFDMPNIGISGTDVTMTISGGSGSAYLAYRVKDSKGNNSTECRIIFTDLAM